MSLPPLNYYTIAQVAKRWDTRKKYIRHYLETGMMRASIWLRRSIAEEGRLITLEKGVQEFVIKEKLLLKGFVQLLPDDCREIFRFGKVEPCLYGSYENTGYFLRLEESAATLCEMDIRILHHDLIRAELEFGIIPGYGKNDAASDDGKIAENRFRFGDDYQTLYAQDKVIRFGIIQANILKQLHQASMTNSPWIHGKILLDKAGSQTVQLKSLFRNKPDWREVIESDGRGYYRLRA